MEEICRQPSSEEGERCSVFGSGDSSSASAKDECEMRVYSVGELLGNTLQSYRQRGWATGAEDNEEEEEFSSSGSVPRPKGKKKGASASGTGKGVGSGTRKKRTYRHVWCPDGEYAMVRSGPPLLYENPDDCIADLTERSLTIFKHTDPTVVFGEDPKRPLWKGVFRMAVGGYGKDEYYEPKKTHLKRIYATDFPKKNRPADNLQVRRDGVVELPYWVDEWYHAKNAEKGHKEKSKKKLQEKSRIEEMSTEVPSTILSPVPSVVFPITGWFKQNLAKRGKAVEQSGGYPYSMALLVDAAKKTIKNMPAILAQLGPVGTAPIPESSLQPKQLSAANVSAAAAAPVTETKPQKKEAKRGKKRVEKDEEEEEEEEAPSPPLKQQKKQSDADTKKKKEAQTKRVLFEPVVAEKPVAILRQEPPPPPPKSQTQGHDVAREAMQTFFNAASAGMATPGTFYYQQLCEKGISFDAFFGHGGPGDCVLPIAQIILKRLK